MIGLIILIAVVLIVVGICVGNEIIASTGSVTLVLFIVIGCFSLVGLSDSFVVDSKIEMYQQENNSIQNDIVTIVEGYKDYEKTTFVDLKTTSATTLVNLYPQLQSNQLVSKQIDVYIENNNKIKQLKDSKISAGVNRWWLYFGN